MIVILSLKFSARSLASFIALYIAIGSSPSTVSPYMPYPKALSESFQYAAEKLSDRALGYGIYGETVDGDDPIAMYKAMKEARVYY
jgi:hypothetical protein